MSSPAQGSTSNTAAAVPNLTAVTGIPPQVPTGPFPPTWRVDDTTPVCDRVAIMEALANDGTTYPSVQGLANQIKERANALAAKSPTNQGTWFARIVALEALRAVQSLPYVPAPEGQEWMQRADYTLANGGECKALSVLLVALCHLLGLHAQIMWITQTGKFINHVSTLIWLDSANPNTAGGRWVWADPSVRGAMLGESPYEAVSRTAAWHVIDGSPPPPTAPAGQVPDFVNYSDLSTSENFPFKWWGWKGLWAGWPSDWWRWYYPYLYQPYSNTYYNPKQCGFYRLGVPVPGGGHGPLGVPGGGQNPLGSQGDGTYSLGIQDPSKLATTSSGDM